MRSLRALDRSLATGAVDEAERAPAVPSIERRMAHDSPMYGRFARRQAAIIVHDPSSRFGISDDIAARAEAAKKVPRARVDPFIEPLGPARCARTPTLA